MLAALATVAVPGLDVIDVRRPHGSRSDFDVAVVIDATRKRWVVRAPVREAAGAALEAELALLEGLGVFHDDGTLPFDVPRPAGYAHLPEGGRAVVYPEIHGGALGLGYLTPGPGLAAAVGRAIAAIHELPTSLVEDAGLPVYDAEAYRRRRLAEVDAAATTGKVPASLLRRWEKALEDVSLWRFKPVVVHGDLSADHVLVVEDRVVGVLDWGEAKVADPADDLAWLLVAAPEDTVDTIMEAYALRRRESADPRLVERAQLAGELALARWLLHGVHTASQEVIDDAEQMLIELDEYTTPRPDPAAEPEAGPEVDPTPQPEA